MNERIKQLLEEAGVKYVVMPKDTVYEKFAELIIDDCAKLVDHVRMEDGTNRGDFIRKHFGVNNEKPI